MKKLDPTKKRNPNEERGGRRRTASPTATKLDDEQGGRTRLRTLLQLCLFFFFCDFAWKMLPFRIYVKYVNQRCNLHVIEPGDCSVISIINDAKELFGCHLKQGKKWQLSITFPWTMQQHVLKTDEEWMTAFELFNERNFSSIEFELKSMPIAVDFPDEPLGLLQYNVGPLDPIVDDDEMVELDPNNDHDIPRPNDVELEDSDTDFQPDDVSSEDSYVS
ncbi:hypothetical protein ACOSP7_006482 [Xanthoceras sorbifolium]